jgi:hypothetical protein
MARNSVLLQGEPFAEFRENWDDETLYFERVPPFCDAVRLINTQTEIIEEALNQPLRNSVQRRQCVAYMVEQCILLCSAIMSRRSIERRRFRILRRLLERVRRVARGDGL